MDVLLIGSRGREHAMALSLKGDARVENIYCIPGNGGLAEIATCTKMDIFDFDGILSFLEEHPSIGLTVVSPDELLAKGLVDFLAEHGHRAFGCSAKAARIETSKEFACELCAKHGIPAPKYMIFDDYTRAKKYVKTKQFPIVVKTEGRTGGKGIIFCQTMREAENAMYDVMVAKLFGSSGDKIDIEEFINGEIITVMAFTDGTEVVPLPAVEIYRRAHEGNLGMSTPGMGASLPAAVYTNEIQNAVCEKIIRPTVDALREDGMPYKGVIGFNIIIDEQGEVKVADFISRMCDVESQVILPLIETPILDIMNAVIDGKLAEIDVKVKKSSGVVVVATSGGYPLEYAKNVKISIGENMSDNVSMFHSGTKVVDGELKTSGGRVITVASFGDTKEECADNVYANISKISFDGMHYRKDIGRPNGK